MRLPTFERDFWQLRSGEESHRDHPETFALPPLEQRQSLRRGQAAKLIFEIETEDENGKVVLTGERMWVIVAERKGEMFIGILDCQPACMAPEDTAYLRFGAEVPFTAEYVIEIAEPPPSYVEWQLSQPPERIWPRDDHVA
ncbi:MAG TPA: hypothetical protein VLE43_13995 [Candidatus Saccharimonadia bacterium]|nr:hypothetical protein [Candidatus Saccharimonadia bacterium]